MEEDSVMKRISYKVIGLLTLADLIAKIRKSLKAYNHESK